MKQLINPVAHIGIIGGGQLGRMLVMAARRLGCAVSVIDPTPNCPAGQLADQQIVAAFDDHDAMQSLVEQCDVTTFEIETIDVSKLAALVEQGHAIYPSPQLLGQLQDKLKQKQLLQQAGLPTAPFELVEQLTEEICADFGYPLVQKARRGGYDGRGVAVLKNADDFPKHLPVPSYIEQFIDAKKELSVLVARDRQGHSVCYPVVEMWVNTDQNVLDSLSAPAEISKELAALAMDTAQRAVEYLQGVGVFGVELFLDRDDHILINEIAPRTHNSGHHTLEANYTDQFEQHLRAVMGWPLGSVKTLSPAVMLNLLADVNSEGDTEVSGLHDVLKMEGANVHIYGKAQVRPYRKMGHVTILDVNIKNAHRKMEEVRKLMTISGTN